MGATGEGAARPPSGAGLTDAGLTEAGLPRRLASMTYEALVLAALLLISGLPLTLIAHQLDPLLTRPIIQTGSLLVAGLFFCWFWTHGGQTLPMKTWRIRLVTADGGPVSWPRAALRFLAALLTVPSGGIGLLWALLDRERRFLHDRIAGTRIVPVPPSP